MTTIAARLPAAFARLNRRRDERLVAGVCAGLAGSARVDPTLVRLVFALPGARWRRGTSSPTSALGSHCPRKRASQSRGGAGSRRRLLLVAFGLALRSVGLADAVLWPAVTGGGGRLRVPVGGATWTSRRSKQRRRRRRGGDSRGARCSRPPSRGTASRARSWRPPGCSSLSVSSSAPGSGGWRRSVTPSGSSASARRSGRTWRRASTTRCCRHSRSSSEAPTIRGVSPHWRGARSASCAAGSTATGTAPRARRSRRALEDALADVEELHGDPRRDRADRRRARWTNACTPSCWRPVRR